VHDRPTHHSTAPSFAIDLGLHAVHSVQHSNSSAVNTLLCSNISLCNKNVVQLNITLLRELHWLKVPERIQFRLCVLTYRCLHGSAPSYLAETIHRASSHATRHLRSADTSTLLVPSTRRSNTRRPRLPGGCSKSLELSAYSCQNAPTLVAFRRELKTVLFRECFSVD